MSWLEGRLSRVVWSSERSGYAIVRVTLDSGDAVAVGTLASLTNEESWGGLLRPERVQALVGARPGGDARVKHGYVFHAQHEALQEAWEAFQHKRARAAPGSAIAWLSGHFDTFLRKHREWLERDSLYVASHTYAIEGMPKDEGQALIGVLIDHITAPEHTYLHTWQPGDIVMWDNRCTLHRGRPWPDDQPRHIVRTTITATDIDGVAATRGVRAAA